ncbi:putative membrane protein YphA (DoxX/SURF4 family) [Rhodococcus sp. 27YEA15]|uniref:DoxX family protein n=1 Tax=Rhodococcus sp. 27YEA15 TaxID=3156259 RepID=UPI003C7E4D1E
MFIATAIVSALLAVLLLASAAGKLRKDPAQVESMKSVGFPESNMWLLATAEIAGAAGLVAGLFWWPIGAAAAIGVILYFIGAVVAHLRVSDGKQLPAIVVLLVAVAALVLRLVSA